MHTLFQRLVNRLTFLPRWVIILIDLSVVALSLGLAFLLRFNFNLSEIKSFQPLVTIPIGLVFAMISTLITKSYAGIVRYTGIQDAIRILYTEFLNIAILILINLIYFYNYVYIILLFSVIFINFITIQRT